jgi:hypothetical protein
VSIVWGQPIRRTFVCESGKVHHVCDGRRKLRSKQTGLDEVIAHGSRHSDNPDTFNGRGNVKAAPAVAFGNKNPNAGGAPMGDVPGGLRPSSKRI